ncbi:hypothetical protein HHK36_023681 [Tetracentron sinense]|uniref:TOG domain-containing protein n=1 Tax=Tetracentron sinense TaxID=13715 RepID=A0A834YN31_TETSI|nr:hypothetical protein HHK36_023681 [Tetracentron sinense]
MRCLRDIQQQIQQLMQIVIRVTATDQHSASDRNSDRVRRAVNDDDPMIQREDGNCSDESRAEIDRPMRRNRRPKRWEDRVVTCSAKCQRVVDLLDISGQPRVRDDTVAYVENLKEIQDQYFHAFSLVNILVASYMMPLLSDVYFVVLLYVKTAVKNKVPLVRSLTLNWVTFCIETSIKAVVLKLHKDYVPICMECLNDGTPKVRDASFSALAAIAKLVGMRPLERSLEKLDAVRKKKLSEMIGGSGGCPLPGTVAGARYDVAEQSGELSRSMSAPILTRENISHSESHTDRHLSPPSLASANDPTAWNEALYIISFGSPEQSIEGMKVVCHKLAQATSDPESSAMDDLVAKTFDISLARASSSSLKYVLHTLMQIFQNQNKRLARAAKESTLDSLFTDLLIWLLDKRVTLMDDGSQLLKALNVLMLKILENVERTSSFVVLINLLHPLDRSRWPSPPSNETFAARNQKFSDLVVQCLSKITRVLQSTIDDVDLDHILQSIHVYLQELGMEEIRRRAGANDKPLGMVKTVIHELVKFRGTAIKGHLSMVPTDKEPQPIILAYIDFCLQQELAAIFKKIGDKKICTIGLFELYHIIQLYPEANMQMEKNAAAGKWDHRTPVERKRG